MSAPLTDDTPRPADPPSGTAPPMLNSKDAEGPAQRAPSMPVIAEAAVTTTQTRQVHQPARWGLAIAAGVGIAVAAVSAAETHPDWRPALALGLANGGTTLKDFRNVIGEVGRNQDDLRAYGRAGQTCPACGALLRGFVHQARSGVFCPVHQAKPRKRWVD